jgi:hypothetical protein
MVDDRRIFGVSGEPAAVGAGVAAAVAAGAGNKAGEPPKLAAERLDGKNLGSGAGGADA